jgi:superfamily I DNA/RNA helicase
MADDERAQAKARLAAYYAYRAGAAGERAVATALQPLTKLGWIILADRRWPGTVANIDLVLVGPGGVVVIDAKNWAVPPRAVNGHLVADDERRDDEVDKLLAVTRLVEQALADLWMSPAAVAPMMIFVRGSVDLTVRGVRVTGAGTALEAIAGLPLRLTADAVRRVAAHLADEFPARLAGQREPESPPELTLFDIHAMMDARRRTAERGPIEEWMTFLDQDEFNLAQQDWSGPARISGVAGTGKTVVALYRCSFLARRSPARILYTTFARSLPQVQKSLFARTDPGLAGRVEFVNLHAWARRFLAGRGLRLKPEHCRDLFDRAWLNAGRRSILRTLNVSLDYWHEEIEYVIKGRGITSLDEYLRVERHGRRTAVQPRQRGAVWELFGEYERLRQESGRHDFADLLLAALTEVHRAPDGYQYGSVIADEVQDFTLVGVKLLHALVGDGPNGLLLVGDGRQAVYPGGFRLADAGIQVRGRSRILRRNYRNGSAIFERAQRFIAGESFDDIDNEPDDQVASLPDDRTGVVIEIVVEGAGGLLEALLDAIRQIPAGPRGQGATAILCATLDSAEYYRRRLTHAGVPTEDLKDYEGHTSAAVKVGTLRRAKGLEFKHVFMPQHDQFIHDVLRRGNATPEWLIMACNQVYVGMTRARDTLWLATIRGRPTADGWGPGRSS